MAEGFNEKFPSESTKNPSDVENSDNEDSMIPDLGVENIRSVDKKSQSNEKGINEALNREENPFSFKYFLNRDNSNYQHQGEGPKMYTPQPPIEDGQIYATINQKDGMVVVKDEPEKYSGLKVLHGVEMELTSCVELDKQILAMDEEIQVNPQKLAQKS